MFRRKDKRKLNRGTKEMINIDLTKHYNHKFIYSKVASNIQRGLDGTYILAKDIKDKLDLIDIVFEVIDARIPYSSKNKDIDNFMLFGIAITRKI